MCYHGIHNLLILEFRKFFLHNLSYSTKGTNYLVSIMTRMVSKWLRLTPRAFLLYAVWKHKFGEVSLKLKCKSLELNFLSHAFPQLFQFEDCGPPQELSDPGVTILNAPPFSVRQVDSA